MNFSLPHISFPCRRRVLRDERGTAVVEFALVLPLLALFLFGVLDFGRAYNYWIDQTHLASEAARYAAVDQNPDPAKASFLEAVRDQASGALHDGGSSVPDPIQLCVSFPNGTHEVGDPVQVEVKSTYQFMDLFGIDLAQDVKATSTMRLERVPTNYADGDCS
jgi:Flp pilus assembly pilin Flp